MFRTDQFRLDKTSRTPQGFLRVDGALTRTGIFTYKNSDGTERREYRPPASVFAPAAMASFDNAPITILHPAGRRVTADNAKELSVGHVREPRADGAHLAGSLIVTDASAIARIERGDLTELSNGYEIDYDGVPGITPEGERYDGTQTNVIGNHVALLPPGQARGGSTCSLRLDSNGDEDLALEVKSTQMTLEQALADLAAAKVRADAATADAAAQKTRADALEGANRALTSQLETASDPKRFASAVDARVALLAQARADSVDVSACTSERAMKVAILAKRLPNFRADGLSDEGINAALAVVVALPHPSMAQPVLAAPALRADGTEEEDALEKSMRLSREATHRLSEKK